MILFVLIAQSLAKFINLNAFNFFPRSSGPTGPRTFCNNVGATGGSVRFDIILDCLELLQRCGY